MNTDTNTLGSSTPSGDESPSRIAYDPEHQRMYVTHMGGGTSLSVIDTVSNTLVTNIPLGGRSDGIAYDSANQMMYVVEVDGPPTVSIIDTDSDMVVNAVSLPAEQVALQPQ
jgi:DNA-binding beta-propeller fold protein YncE